jgi:hypothetical protein
MRAIRVNALGSYVLGLANHPPPAATAAPPIKVLPNHDIVALGELPLGDRMTLSAFADLSAERVWRLTETSVLAGVANGRRIDDLLHLLDRAADRGLPATVNTLIADVKARCAALADQGMVRLVECRDAATAMLIAKDRRTGAHCALIGERHLAIGAEQEVAFRAALAQLRYVLPPGSSASHPS